MFVLLAIVAAPILFFMLAWVAATAYRIYFPDRPMPLAKDAVVVRRRRAALGKHVPVGVREIREDQRRYLRQQVRVPYHYAGSASEGLPSAWMEDLWRRRN